MRTVHKYELNPHAGYQHIEVRKGAILLKIAEQANKICVWFEVDTNEDWQHVDFILYETGAQLEAIHERCEYIDTILLLRGTYVLHVYKINP